MKISWPRVGLESYDWWAWKRSEASCRLVDNTRYGFRCVMRVQPHVTWRRSRFAAPDGSIDDRVPEHYCTDLKWRRRQRHSGHNWRRNLTLCEAREQEPSFWHTMLRKPDLLSGFWSMERGESFNHEALHMASGLRSDTVVADTHHPK